MGRRTPKSASPVVLTWPDKPTQAAVADPPGPLAVRERVGEPAAWQDRLIWGENSLALAALRAELGAAIDLVYIDPPFDVGGAHYLRSRELEVVAYEDAWGGPGYLSMLYPRLALLRALMKPTATIVVHVGVNVSHRVRVIMDEIFGAENFVNQVAWKRYSAHNDARQGARRLGAVHDVLLLYGMGPKRAWTTLRAPYDPDYVAKWYRHVEAGTGRRFMSSPLTAPGGAAKGNPCYEFLGVRRFWRYGQATMEALYRSGRVYQTRPGAVPRQKHYLDEQEGVPLQDVWTDIRALQGTHAERVGYDTQKPEALLERLVLMCSRPGDLVLDAFAGSGTTAAVAARCGRRWVAIDRSPPAFAVIRRRMRAMAGRGEASPFAVVDAGPAARRALVARIGEDGLRARVLALHGAEAWSKGQLCGRRGAAAVAVAASEARPTGADVARWAAEARAAGARRVEVLAWAFDPSAHDVDPAEAALWEIPRALAEGEEVAPRRAPRLTITQAACAEGAVICLSGYAAPGDGDREQWEEAGIDALVEWAVDWAWDGAVFVPRWSTQRGRDGRLTSRAPPIGADLGPVMVEAVDAAGRISARLLR